MILILGNSSADCSTRLPDRGWVDCGANLCYTVGPTERKYETEDYLVLLSCCLDLADEPLAQREIERTIAIWREGGEPGAIFNGVYFVVIYDKRANRLTVWRDPSGVMSGYYTTIDQGILVGNEMHAMARMAQAKSFDREAICQMLYTLFYIDGRTLYEDLHEVRRGERLTFDSAGKITESRVEPLNLAREENSLSTAENIAGLRRAITDTMKRHAGTDNVVLLSGGIDSVVMLACLEQLRPERRVRAVSYVVRGTDQDETGYARETAEHMGVEFEIKEIDPEDPNIDRQFSDYLLAMNNPYYGVFIFGDLPGATSHNKFFAGQDTRLHTPDLNILDRFAFRVFFWRKNRFLNLLLEGVSLLARPLEWFDLSHASSRLLKGIGRLPETLNTGRFIRRYHFHCDQRVLKRENLPLDQFDSVMREFELDLTGVDTYRELYNRIAAGRWRHQFVANIRYLTDMGSLNQSYLSLPFYDLELARFQSTLPFGLATRRIRGRDKFGEKETKIDKYLLRMAFKDQISERSFTRKKAVSMTLELLLSGQLGRTVRREMIEDLARPDSFIRDFKLEAYVQPFVKDSGWRGQAYRYQYGLYYVACFCLYHREVLKATQEESTVAERTNVE